MMKLNMNRKSPATAYWDRYTNEHGVRVELLRVQRAGLPCYNEVAWIERYGRRWIVGAHGGLTREVASRAEARKLVLEQAPRGVQVLPRRPRNGIDCW